MPDSTPIPDPETRRADAPPAEAAIPARSARGPVYLEPVQVTTCILDGAGRVVDKGQVLVSCGLRNDAKEERSGVVTVTLRDTGQVVERQFRLAPGESSRAALPGLSVMFPHPWWPWERGRTVAEQERRGPRALYSIDLEVVLDGVLSDQERVRFGLREVALEEPGEEPAGDETAEQPGAPEDGDREASGEEARNGGEGPGEGAGDGSEGAGPRPRTTWGLTVNGLPLERREGEVEIATWSRLSASDSPGVEAPESSPAGGSAAAEVAEDSAPTAAAADVGHRIHTAVRELAERGVDLLLVPWGDLDERDALLDACDERGLPVALALWPDGHPDDPDLAADDQLAEARAAMRRLRNHPCVVLWTGGVDSAPPEGIDHCLRCYVRGRDADGKPCRFTGDTPCGAHGILDGNRPYLPTPRDLRR